MTDRLRRQLATTPGARWRLALLLLLCGLAGLAGVQPHGGDTANGSQTVAQWEHSSQGIPSEKRDARLGPRSQGADQDSPSLPEGDPFDLFWLAFESTATRIESGLAATALPDAPRPQLRQPLKDSPQAPRGPPSA